MKSLLFPLLREPVTPLQEARGVFQLHLISAIAFLIFNSTQLFAQQKELTLSQAILSRDVQPETLRNLQWLPNSEGVSYTVNGGKAILRQSLKGKLDTLLKIDDVRKGAKFHAISSLNGYKWMDENTLFLKGKNSGYSFNLEESKATRLFEEMPGVQTASGLQKTTNQDVFYAAGKEAFTRGNNLYVLQDGSETVVAFSSDKNVVTGQAISRSEFGIRKGTFWSPSGSMLAFYQKDESLVGEYPLMEFHGEEPGKLKSIKYPMAGQNSEMVRVGIFHNLSRKVVFLQSKKDSFDYMTNVGWDANENFVYVAELNRDQNHMQLNKYNALTGEFVATLFEEKSETWVEPEHAPYFLPGHKNKFVWISERDGFNNLYLYNTDGKLLKQLTQNKFVVKKIVGADPKGKHVFFLATGPNPTETHLYKVEVKSGKQTLLTLGEGTHNATLSPNGNYFIDDFSSTAVPHNIEIRQTKDGYSKLNLLAAENPLADFAISKPEIFTLKSADGETDLYARMIKPSHFDANKKYPVIVYVYGGPHAQMVRNKWLGGAPLWMYHQAEKGYIIFTVDNRGSAYRGEKFEKIIHRNLGAAEMDDQEAGVNYLEKQPFVDTTKLAVHGWSYGGFMTTSLMLRKPGLFKVGVAGGPVTNWKYYEVMYGERYMDRPEENPEGYEANALKNYVKNLQGDLLLIHGTVDDVVVMQHNFALVKAFVDAGVQVDFFPYPMHPHNVRGKDRIHLMTKVLEYIEEKLGE